MAKDGAFRSALIFQSRMVLQREKKIPLWGTGRTGDTVTVEIQKKRVDSLIEDGKWSVLLPPLETSLSETMVLNCGNEKIVFDEIAVGEVWIAGGQSNMEFFVRYDEDRENIIQSGENRHIRFFDYPEVSYPGQIEEKDYSRYGTWRPCDQHNLKYFSAVGYHFAAKLQYDLNVPIGIVGCNWGGTPACAWMSPEYLEKNDGRVWLEEYEEATAGLDLELYEQTFRRNPANFRTDLFSDRINEKLMFGLSREEQLEFMDSPDYSNTVNIGPKDPNRPGGLYESMVKEIAPYAARGVIWYQGESDAKYPEQYEIVFSSMIRCWRDTWKEELPFLFVQLAPFRQWLECKGDLFPIVRRAQDEVSKNVSATWMACIMDSGMEWDIHPPRKRPVGTRLALLAEGKVYGKAIPCESPECTEMTVRDGRAELFFNHAEGGLFCTGDRINAFEVRLDGIPLKKMEIIPAGSTVQIKSKEIRENSRIQVLFAYTDYCEVNLFNEAGLPVKPFVLQ